MSFPRYPKYKDSGVEWLGKVPAHWAMERFKRIFKEREERSVEGNGTLLSVSAYTGVSPRSEVIDEGDHLSRAESLEGYKVCYVDDLVMNIMLAWNRGLAFTLYDGIVSPAYCVFYIIDDSNPRFLNYLVRSDRYTLYFKAFSAGVIDSRLRIYPETFGRLFCGLPPKIEQTKIAEFLDYETVKIDELVAEQQRLMELLKEKRQAVISHAVTKGLNPNAPMKPSGIEWLGDVPKHWEVKRLRFVAELNPSKSEVSNLERDTIVSFLPMEDIGEDGTLNLDKEKPISELENGYTYFRDGDVTVAKITPCYENGKGALMRGLVNGIGFGTTELIVARPKQDEVIGSFLHYLFISKEFRSLGESRMYGAGGQKRVPDTFLRNFATAFPPIHEQALIAAFLDNELSKFNTLTAEAQRAIDLLQERRTALISAAVTGQIDVRSH